MHIHRLLGEARPGLIYGMTPPTHGVIHPLCDSSTGGGEDINPQRPHGEPRRGEKIGNMQRVLEMGGARDMIIHDNTPQRGVRQEQQVLRGEVQQRLLHPASQRQLQHPEPPRQLQWVWTLLRGGPIGDVDSHGSPWGAKWSEQ